MVDPTETFKRVLAKFSSKDIEALSNSIALMGETKKHLVSPYHPPQPSTVNPAEFIALRVIVMVLVAEPAGQYEASGAGSAQDWINQISARCQESLLAADISGEGAERLRREAMDHINIILGGVRGAK